MLRSNFDSLKILPATEALESFLTEEENLCASPAVAKDTTSSLLLSLPKLLQEDMSFPIISWFPEEGDDAEKSDAFQSDASLCSKDSSLSLDSSWKQPYLKRGSSGAGGLHRCKRLASELHMLRPDQEELHRSPKRRCILS